MWHKIKKSPRISVFFLEIFFFQAQIRKKYLIFNITKLKRKKKKEKLPNTIFNDENFKELVRGDFL
jgi:hypothetical protein